MILPTANGMAKLQSSSQSKAKLNKTQVGLDSHFILYSLLTIIAETCSTLLVLKHCSRSVCLLPGSRFPLQAAQLLRSTPASRSPPVNSAWERRSSLHRLNSTECSSTRRWASPDHPPSLNISLLLRRTKPHVTDVLWCLMLWLL